MYGGPPAQQSNQQQQKHDIFVGNLAFNTTEDQLHQAFSEIGRVLKVRMVTDLETGKPRGFAFVEFEDPQAALSAIRNMNDYELNGRRIRVNFSNSSHLEALAGKLGMDMPSNNNTGSSSNSNQNQSRSGGGGGGGTDAVAQALKSMSKGEMYDVVKRLKEIADRDPDEARRILSGHPQLPEAILFLMSKLEMIQTPVPTATATSLPPGSIAPPPPPVRAADPRQRAADPRQAAADPRARMDPRAARGPPARQPPPPPPPQFPPPPPYGVAPPPPAPGGVNNLDPSLVQQVMSLTPEQISHLPPDKQQSIMALRRQITGR